ncbi:hypothetical protein [Nitrosospira sp. NRS527]|uniref:hypothetical protein n=1 Tax=Nitrosospira sp. NRS527 TaxID=155925 RepID=UPI001AF125BD|nr:hypothetical protein [Nitrosospira sp. NRS527]BCT69534.1 hypothetical protein NNRS527_03159 [Nitrosospira sp. NRS527]
MITINNGGQKIISTNYWDTAQPAHMLSAGRALCARTPGLESRPFGHDPVAIAGSGLVNSGQADSKHVFAYAKIVQ